MLIFWMLNANKCLLSVAYQLNTKSVHILNTFTCAKIAHWYFRMEHCSTLALIFEHFQVLKSVAAGVHLSVQNINTSVSVHFTDVRFTSLIAKNI